MSWLDVYDTLAAHGDTLGVSVGLAYGSALYRHVWKQCTPSNFGREHLFCLL